MVKKVGLALADTRGGHVCIWALAVMALVTYLVAKETAKLVMPAIAGYG